jgi:uncharacterized membrane protein
MKFSLRTEWPLWALIACIGLASAAVWPMTPERIPVHWNLQGEVDRYGGKVEGLLLLPLVALGIYLLLTFLPRIDPGRANYERFRSAYLAIRFAILALLAVLHATFLLSALGYRLDVARIVFFAIGTLFLVLGNLMGKIRPNWFVGVRTPWTLSSKLSWTRTHRVAGWIMVLWGLVTYAAVLLPIPWGFAVFFSTIVLGTVWLVIYSYLVWRRDPDRIPPAGTTPGES